MEVDGGRIRKPESQKANQESSSSVSRTPHRTQAKTILFAKQHSSWMTQRQQALLFATSPHILTALLIIITILHTRPHMQSYLSLLAFASASAFAFPFESRYHESIFRHSPRPAPSSPHQPTSSPHLSIRSNVRYIDTFLNVSHPAPFF